MAMLEIGCDFLRSFLSASNRALASLFAMFVVVGGLELNGCVANHEPLLDLLAEFGDERR